ncbi:MAG: QueT transporter family protein [Streptococcus salivarius]
MKTKLNTTQKLVLSAIMMALYIAILFVSSHFLWCGSDASGHCFIWINLHLPIFGIPLVKLMPSQLFGGLGLIDVVGGFCASFLTTGSIYLIRKAKLSSWFIILPILLVPALVVPIWLSALLKLPYFALVINLLLGQLVPAILGAVLVRELAKRGYKD